MNHKIVMGLALSLVLAASAVAAPKAKTVDAVKGVKAASYDAPSTGTATRLAKKVVVKEKARASKRKAGCCGMPCCDGGCCPMPGCCG